MRPSRCLAAALALLAAAPSAQPTIAWNDDASAHRGRSGTVTVICPAAGSGGRGHAVWGSNPYTDDSSVCRAAVHAGAIGWGGGRVVFEPRPGQSSYAASERNGVSTSSYGAWGGSFAILSGGGTAAPTVTWDTDARDVLDPADKATVVCPAARSGTDREHTVWGTDVYTDDSSVCRAAVHAGVIGWGGGTVTLEARPGQTSYRASTRHGVETRAYGRWGRSFVFVR